MIRGKPEPPDAISQSAQIAKLWTRNRRKIKGVAQEIPRNFASPKAEEKLVSRHTEFWFAKLVRKTVDC
jgi:hypothetical protein